MSDRGGPTLYALAGLGAIALAVLGVIAILQTQQGHEIKLPEALVSLATLAFTALFGQGLFLGHRASTANTVDQMLSAGFDRRQTPSETNGSTPATTYPSTIPSAPAAPGSGGTR